MPIIVQNALTNFVSMLDNIMIGRVGTVQMTGASVANQLIFVFNLAIFGAVSGVSIFTAQFYGNGDNEGIRFTLRAKLIICVFITLIGVAIMYFFGTPLINNFLKGEGALEDASASLDYGLRYIRIIFIGLLPFSLSQAFATTLRETGETVLPMKAGIAAILVNLTFNYILIFGHFGAPALGVEGAAIATALSRFVELAIILIYLLKRRKDRFPYMQELLKSLYIPGGLVKKMVLKGFPLLLNETLWSMGVTLVNQCYSTRSLDVVAAININSTVWNVLACSYLAMGSATAILVGKALGSGSFEDAMSTAKKMLASSLFLSLVVAGLMAAVSGVFPLLYNTSDSIRELASGLILISAAATPFSAMCNSLYFTLRSGGKTLITFLFDSGCQFFLTFPIVWLFSRFTNIPVLPLFAIGEAMSIVKCAVGFPLMLKGIWLNNIITDKPEVAEQ